MMRKDIEVLRDKYNIKIENINMNRAKQMRIDKFVILFAEEYKGFFREGNKWVRKL